MANVDKIDKRSQREVEYVWNFEFYIFLSEFCVFDLKSGIKFYEFDLQLRKLRRGLIEF